MATIANLNILLSLKDNASGALTKAGNNIQKWGQSMQSIGAGLTAGVTVPALAAGVAVVKMASDQQEAISAVEQVYGDASATVLAYGDDAAKAMGMAKSEYLSAAAVFGVYSSATGLAGEDSAQFAQDNLQLAADLGSFYNDSTENVTAALQAAYRGEFDSLDKYGIMLNQATLEQFALEQGIYDGNGAMTTQEKILATNAYLQANAGAASGDFARTSGSLANKQKILRAQLKNVAAQLGQVLLPAVTKIVAIFSKLLDRFKELSPKWQKWIVIIGLVVAAIGPFLLVLGTILTMLPAIGAALTVLTGPIGLVIAAIALLTAAYVGNWWGFRDAVDGVAGAVGTVIGKFNEFTIVQTTVQSVVDTVSGLFDRLTGALDKVGGALLRGDWRTAIAGIGDLLSAPAKAIGEFIKGIETGFPNVDRILDMVGNNFTSFGRIIQEVFQGDWRGAYDVFIRLINRIPQIVIAAFGLIPWETIGATIATGIQAIPGLITDAGTLLYGVGADLIGGAINGIQTMLEYVGPIVGRIPGIAVEAVGELGETLYRAGADLIGGALGGVNRMIGYLAGRVGEIPGLAVEAVGELGETLFAAGADLIGGALGGVNSMIGYFQSRLGEIPGMALTAVGSLGTLLYGAGADLIGGFIGGIQSMIDSVENVLVGLTGKIIGWKGPPKKDAVLLWNNGQLIMSGLIGGIESQVPSLRRSLGGITANIGGAMSASASANVQGGSGGGYGRGGGGFQNYGTYYEADRHWEPQNTLNSYSIARSRG